LSDKHFSVDGTLVKAWASMKSFQPKTATTPPDDPGEHPLHQRLLQVPHQPTVAQHVLRPLAALQQLVQKQACPTYGRAPGPTAARPSGRPPPIVGWQVYLRVLPPGDEDGIDADNMRTGRCPSRRWSGCRV
jgi:hypothetical protein